MKKVAFLILVFAVFAHCSSIALTVTGKVTHAITGAPLNGVLVQIEGETNSTRTNAQGAYTIQASIGDILVFRYHRLQTERVKVKRQTTIYVSMYPETRDRKEQKLIECNEVAMDRVLIRGVANRVPHTQQASFSYPQPDFNTENYATIHENGYKEAMKDPLSTFSIDVDAASYSNVRRFLNEGRMPAKDAVRIEEMVNYFTYDYPEPRNGHPFSINHEMARCPWNKDHVLLHVGLQGEKLEMENLPPSNIVFLIDVSGSMRSHNKLPLLKKAFKLLVQELRAEDRVAIVVYAGSSGLVLPATKGNDKETILGSLERLQAGGSTAGAAGLKLAYKVASENFISGGNNRVILATDGDFNIGQSSDAEMERLIEKKRDQGVFISVLGFGSGNYKDSKMEIIADKGNGNYAYIDNILEAKKVLVNEFGGTLYTIAKDVKIQVEFNPAVVESYRLIGYENRLLNDEDFANDTKDAGELGSGHSVTALYEVKLATGNSASQNDLKYQTAQLNQKAKEGDEMATVKFRYKKPNGNKSTLMEEIIPYNDNVAHNLSEDFQFSAAVAGFGMLLRNSEHKGYATYDSIIRMAQQGKGEDEEGYRSEFIRLVKLAQTLGKAEMTSEK